MQVEFELSKGEPVEFAVKNEPWAKYKLEDKTLLFARLIVTKIIRTERYDPSGQPVYAWTSQNLFTTLGQKDLRGAPSIPSPTSANPKDFNVTQVDFERVGNEQWNIYEIADGSILRIKLEPTSILRTDKFSFDGDPYYIITSQSISRVKVTPNLIKKQASRASNQSNIYK